MYVRELAFSPTQRQLNPAAYHAYKHLRANSLRLPFARTWRASMSAVVISDPLGDRSLERSAFMPALQFPEGRLTEVSEVRPLALSATRGRVDVNHLAQVPACAVFPPLVATRLRRSFRRFAGRFSRPSATRGSNALRH